MDLFRPKQRDIPGAEEKLRSLHEQINRATLELNRVTYENKERLEKLREDVAKEEIALVARLDSLKSEVASLENRKKEALRPLTERKKAVDDRENELHALKDRLDARAEALRSEEERLRDLSERLSDLAGDAERRLSEAEAKSEGAIRQASVVATLSEALNKRIADWNGRVTKKESEIGDRESVLALHRAEIDADKLWCAEERVRLTAEQKKIDSQRSTLRNAFEELKKKTT